MLSLPVFVIGACVSNLTCRGYANCFCVCFCHHPWASLQLLSVPRNSQKNQRLFSKFPKLARIDSGIYNLVREKNKISVIPICDSNWRTNGSVAVPHTRLHCPCVQKYIFGRTGISQSSQSRKNQKEKNHPGTLKKEKKPPGKENLKERKKPL